MRKYFFPPRIGPNYIGGFDGLRTLIVGPHMICEIDCPHKHKCADSTSVRDMDTHCPVYAGLDPEVMRLSNANDIEVSAYINGEGAYPAYSAFTYYMLGKQDYLSEDDKRRLWNAVAFTNFLQHLRPSDQPCDPALFEHDYEAFKEAYDTLDPKPEVLYVWNTLVKDCLKKHPTDFRYIGKADMGYALSVYIFVSTVNPPKSQQLRRLKYRRGVRSEKHFEGWYQTLVHRHLGRSFTGNDATVRVQKIRLAHLLKSWVDSGWLGADEDSLYFRDSDTMRWTSTHIGYFLKKIKDGFGLQKGTNEGIAAMFNEPNVAKCPNDIRRLGTPDRLISKIEEYFGKSSEKHT